MARRPAEAPALTAHHNCEFRQVLDRVGDKWSLLVIAMLEQRPTQRARFSELKRSIPGISQRMLTATVRNLGINVAREQAVALEASQRRRQHPLRDSGNASLQLRKPRACRRPLFEHGDDEEAPLVTDPVQHLAKLAVVMGREHCGRNGWACHSVPSR